MLGLVLLAVVAWLLPYRLNIYWISVADTALLFALLAVGMGLVMGIAGQVNLAQIAFFGVGAYVTAILTTHDGYGFWVAGLLAVAATVLVGLVVGTPALRIQSHYLGIVTLGLAVAFVDWITNAPVTGGDSGISGIPAPPLSGIDLSSQYLYYYLELIVLVLGLAFGIFVVRTPLGRRMRAMRDDALAAGSSGAEIPVLRMIAFVLASVYGGVAGVLYAGLIHYIAPATFSIANMFLLLAMVIIGGRRSLAGCVTGAIVLTVAQQELINLAAYAQLGYGLLVVLVVVFAPTGLVGIPARLASRWARRRGRSGEAAALEPFRPLPAADAVASGGVLLEVSGLVKRFRGVTAVDGVLVERAPRRDPRRGRAERVGQDHAVQRDQRPLPAVVWARCARWPGCFRGPALPDLAAWGGADVPAPAVVRQPDRAGEPAGGAGPDPLVVELAVRLLAVRGVAARAGAAAPGFGTDDLVRAGPVRRGAAWRAAVRDPAPSGAGPCRGGRAAAVAAG